MAPTFLTTTEEYKKLVDKFDTFMFDCDGVIWHGDQLVPSAREVLSILRERKKHIIFVTNNATKSRRNYKQKFDKLSVQAEIDEIFGSAYASAVYLSSVVSFPKTKKVYVIGQAGLEEELDNEGVAHIGGTDPEDNNNKAQIPFSLDTFVLDPDVNAVLCGLDTAINYTKLSKALQYLTRVPECLFLATNTDPTFPAEGGRLLPGAGSIGAPIRYALGRDPISCGKPNKVMLDCIKAKHNFDPAKTLMIGDRLDTDILFGQKGGLSTLLVLTGVTKRGEVEGENASSIVPDFVLQSIGDLVAVSSEQLRS